VSACASDSFSLLTRRGWLSICLPVAISPLMGQSGRALIHVVDPTGAVVPFAEVSLVGQDGKISGTAIANAAGEVVLADIPMGTSKFRVSYPGGFASTLGTLIIRDSDEINVNARLYLIAGDDIEAVGEGTENRSLQDVTAMAPPFRKITVPLAVPEVPAAPLPAPKKRKHWWPFVSEMPG